MKLNKSVIEGVVVLSLASALTITAVVSDSSFVRGTSQTVKEYVFDADSESNGVAGISEVLLARLANGEDESNTVTVEKSEVSLVASGLGSESSVTRDEIQLTAEQTNWLDYLFADVDGKLNVREGASTDTAIVGKIGADERATILERGEEWTKISSGNVVGYVYNQYCIFGVDALAYAEDTLDKVAVTTASTSILSEMKDGASVLETAEAETTLTVSTETATQDGWVAVIAGDSIGYVKSSSVTVDYNVGHALTVEEDEAEQKRLREEQMKKYQVAPPSRVYGDAIELSEDEIAVMCAIVALEAGDNYEGCVAVAAVICNRIKSASFPNNFYSVVYQSGQFYPLGSAKLERQIARGASAQTRAAVEEALAGADPTNGCHFFFATYTGHAGYVIGGNVFFNGL